MYSTNKGYSSEFLGSLFIPWCRKNLQGFTHNKGDFYMAKCPIHNDRNKSLRIFGNTAIFQCFGACSANMTGRKWWPYYEFCRLAHLTPIPPAVAYGNGYKTAKACKKPLASYVYMSERGDPLYRVDKYEGKKFPLYHFKGGKWEKGLIPGALPPLYHLEELVALPDGSTVLFCEGEKDADRVRDIGMFATSKLGGANTHGLTSEVLEPLRRHIVIIIPDNDPAGVQYALHVQVLLRGMNCKAVICPLPIDKPGGDISDFIENEETAGRDPAASINDLLQQTFWRFN